MPRLILHKDGAPIRSVNDWLRLAPPKLGRRQWKNGRSAKELSKAFFRAEEGPQVPEELTGLLNSATGLEHVRIREATPEYKIQIDSFPGETRNADLVCLADCFGGPLAVNIEAKADESFGPTVAERLMETINHRSNLPKRIVLLQKALFAETNLDRIGRLRYQLLHATAASLIYAKQQDCNLAVLVVYEFTGRTCKKRNLERNANDLQGFAKALSRGSISYLPTGTLMGPISVPGGEYVPKNIPLYLGKVSHALSETEPTGD